MREMSTKSPGLILAVFVYVVAMFSACSGPRGTGAGTEADRTTRYFRSLKTRDPYGCKAAAEALVKMGMRSAAIESLACALRDTDTLVRMSAGFSLVTIDPPAMEPLRSALHDGDPTVRSEVVVALGAAKGSWAVDLLVAAMGDSAPRVRRLAAWKLGEVHDARAVSTLTSALEDADQCVRRNAAEALVKIGRPLVEDAVSRRATAICGQGFTSIGTRQEFEQTTVTTSQKSCSRCRHVVSDDSHPGQYCPYCGAYWSTEETQGTGSLPRGFTVEEKRCASCGRVVPISVSLGQHCPYCGASW